jgi:hypothetical protein
LFDRHRESVGRCPHPGDDLTRPRNAFLDGCAFLRLQFGKPLSVISDRHPSLFAIPSRSFHGIGQRTYIVLVMVVVETEPDLKIRGLPLSPRMLIVNRRRIDTEQAAEPKARVFAGSVWNQLAMKVA